LYERNCFESFVRTHGKLRNNRSKTANTWEALKHHGHATKHTNKQSNKQTNKHNQINKQTHKQTNKTDAKQARQANK